MEEEVLCPICQAVFEDCEEVFPACHNGHVFHPACLSHWFQSNALLTAAAAAPTTTCPVCRDSSSDWRTITVYKVTAAPIPIAVRNDFTVMQVKKQIEWVLSTPACSMELAIVIQWADPTNNFTPIIELLLDSERVPSTTTDRDFFVTIRAMDAEYTLIYDIPRCTGVEARFKCPISRGLLLDPVVGADGHMYDRGAIQMWIARNGDVSPFTRISAILPLAELIDPEFTTEVAAIVPDAVREEDPPSRETIIITLRTHLPESTGNGTIITARLDENIADVARRIHPRAIRVVTESRYLFRLELNATLSQCKIKDGDMLYVSF